MSEMPETLGTAVGDSAFEGPERASARIEDRKKIDTWGCSPQMQSLFRSVDFPQRRRLGDCAREDDVSASRYIIYSSLSA